MVRRGLASSTDGCAITRSSTRSSNPVVDPVIEASACPVAVLTADENSFSADALIKYTA
jgi:hypothetical protein